MSDYKMLKKALDLAREKHAGQYDKSGVEYIFHPVLVALQCKSDEAKIVGLLHDVLEDTDITVEELKELGFDQKIIASLLLLTHTGMSYEDYIRRRKESSDEVAIEVKLADLTMNMDTSRLNGQKPAKYDLYLWAMDYLKS